MLIIDNKNILIASVDTFDGTYYYSKSEDCYYEKKSLQLTEVNVPLPNEVWAKPQTARFENGIWVEHKTEYTTKLLKLQQMVLDGKITQAEMDELL